MQLNTDLFRPISLDEQHQVWIGNLPASFNYNKVNFQELWDMHPEEYHIIRMRGKDIPTPRWQQAYGKNYSYTGSKNNALPINPIIQKYQDWCTQHIDEQLNGLLLNWYDGKNDHYIGAHRDDTRELVTGSSIVTISLGEERIFRMRPHGGSGFQNLLMQHGTVIIVPWETNLKWTHEVPHFKRFKGKRISITLRVFKD